MLNFIQIVTLFEHLIQILIIILISSIKGLKLLNHYFTDFSRIVCYNQINNKKSEIHYESEVENLK